MEGTWGRRIYGRVIKGDSNTVFILEMELRNSTYKRVRTVSNSRIKAVPEMYGWVLDLMVKEIEEVLKKQV